MRFASRNVIEHREVLQSASLRLEDPISTQLRDGFIRPRSLPFHRLLPRLSLLSFGLTVPQQPGVRLPQTHICFIWLPYAWRLIFALGYQWRRELSLTEIDSEYQAHFRGTTQQFFYRFCLAEKQQNYSIIAQSFAI